VDRGDIATSASLNCSPNAGLPPLALASLACPGLSGSRPPHDFSLGNDMSDFSQVLTDGLDNHCRARSYLLNGAAALFSPPISSRSNQFSPNFSELTFVLEFTAPVNLQLLEYVREMELYGTLLDVQDLPNLLV
jgi:hypothetical protein